MAVSHGGEIDINEGFQRALDLIGDGKCVFITGRAGTGKSTLLNHLVDSDDIPQVVLAPTGVAALNVNGQTIHRFFGFPSSVTPEQVESGQLFPRRNIGVIKSVQRIIIDEVSMVRADLMDCLETSLRIHGPNPGQPFGGVQMVFVGDPYQLPPVVEDEEAEFFATHYQTPFFFSSHALGSLEFETVELEQIYRQSDQEFIELLNAIRENTASNKHFDRLAQNVDAEFAPPPDELFITLATTNNIVDRVNGDRLASLAGDEFQRIAEVTGDFPSRPNATDLRFKTGAQIMMLTNDPTDRWVNGSLGMIVDVQFDSDFNVSVLVYDTGEIVEVEPHRWSVTQPRMDSGRLVHDDVGTFKQLPFALAWAITIHKSQGKTFDKVIIDLGGGTRSNGQLYVALSRARSLEGIVLRQPIRPKHVSVEDDVSRFFARRHLDDGTLANQAIAVLATNVTGHNTNDRIVELAAVIIRDGVVVDEFDTMVHPLRDVTGSWEHGVTATMASMAPSFSEAWAAISPSLEGCVLVAHGLAPLSRQLRQEFKALNMLPGSLGLGVCTKEQTKADLIEACNNYGVPLEPIPNALTNARAVTQLITRLGGFETTFTPMKNLEAGESPPRLQRRPDQLDDLIRDLESLSAPDEPSDSYARALARFLDDGRLDEIERRYLDSLAKSLHLDTDSRREIQERFCTSLVEAAARDEEMTDEEWDYIALVHADLEIECPARPPARPDQVVELFRSMEVYFTGFPLEGPGGYYEYVALATSIGLVEVRDVSTRKCQLVVALDRASTSSKSKKARSFGIPIIHISEFLELVESGVMHDPPERVEPPPRNVSRARSASPVRKAPRPPKVPVILAPEELPKNRSIGNYSIEQLVSVIALLDPDRSLEDNKLLDQCVAFLEFDQRSPQRMKKLSQAIDAHRGEPEGSSRARQDQRLATSIAGDLAASRSDSSTEFVPQPGMGICFTGAAVINGEKVLRKVLQNAAAAAGLVVLEGVNSECNVLVYADENARSTKKVKKALAMGIEGMTVERFASLYLGDTII
jgi:hypothetical protein